MQGHAVVMAEQLGGDPDGVALFVEQDDFILARQYPAHCLSSAKARFSIS